MAASTVEIIIKGSDALSPILSGIQGSLAGLGKSATALGKKLSLGLTAPIVGIGTAAVKMASDMDREMKNIQSISKATGPVIAALSQTFVDMSTDLTVTTDSAVKLAQGFYTIQGSGFAGADAMTVLEAATKAASAGLTDTEVAAKAITAALNAYGVGAERAAGFSDLMFRTVDIGVGTFEELSNSLGYVVGTASQAGVGFDEVSAALSTMSKQGIEFNKAGRALNMLLLELIKPSDDMMVGLKGIGFYSGQAALDSLGLVGVLQALEAAGYGGTEGFASLGLSSMALRSALALTGTGAEMFAGDLIAMQGASEGAGAAQEAFAIQTQSFSAQMANFKNIVHAAGITLGNVLLPVLSDLLNQVKPLIQRFTELDPAVLKIILKVGALAAAAGPVLMILGTMVTVIGALLSPIGLVVVAVAALALAWAKSFGGIEDAVEGIRGTVMPIFAEIGERVRSLADAFREGGLSGLVAEFKDQLQELGEALVGWIGPKIPVVMAKLGVLAAKIVAWVGDQIPKIQAKVSEWAAAFIGWIGPKIPVIVAGLGELAQSVLAWIGEQIPVIRAKLLEWGTAFVDWIGPMIPPALKFLGNLVIAIWDWVARQAPILWERLQAWAEAFVDWIKPYIPVVLTRLAELGVALFGWIREQIPIVIEQVKGWANAFVEWVKETTPILIERLKKLAQDVIAWICNDAVPLLKEKLGQWAEAFVTWLETENVPGKLLEGLGDLIGKVVHWILAEGIPLVVNTIRKLASAIVGAFKGGEGGEPSLVSRVLSYLWDDFLPSIVEGLKSIGKAIIGGIAAGLTSAFPDFMANVKDLGGQLVQEFKDLLGIGSPSLVFKGIAIDIIKGLTQGLESATPAAVAQIKYTIQEIENAMGIALESEFAADFGVGVIKQIEDGLSKASPGAVEALKKLQQDMAKQIGTATDGGGAPAGGGGGGGGGGLPDFKPSVPQWVLDKVAQLQTTIGAKTKAIAKMKTVPNWESVLIRDINKLLKEITTYQKQIAGLKAQYSFAKGGIVPGPIGRAQLGLLHGGETVTPYGRGFIPPGQGAQQRGGDIVINLDGREIARVVSPYMANELNRRGVRSLA